MKKLNRKGFTLVELLAVIVILAIVVGITLVTVLPTLSKSKIQAFETAVETVKVFVRDEYDKCLIGDANVAGAAKIKFADGCTVASNANATWYEGVAKAAGYAKEDLVITKITITNGVVSVSAYAPSAGRFANDSYNSASKTYTS